MEMDGLMIVVDFMEEDGWVRSAVVVDKRFGWVKELSLWLVVEEGEEFSREEKKTPLVAEEMIVFIVVGCVERVVGRGREEAIEEWMEGETEVESRVVAGPGREGGVTQAIEEVFLKDMQCRCCSLW